MHVLHASVTSEVKAGWRALARRSGCAESELLRQVVTTVLTNSGAIGAEQMKQEAKPPERSSIRLELEAHEVAAIEKAAAQLGWKRSTWLVSQIRTLLFREPRTTQDERAALMKSNAELRAVGRNLNQIARALHRRGDSKIDLTVQRLDELRQIINHHADRVNALLEAAENRWLPPDRGRDLDRTG